MADRPRRRPASHLILVILVAAGLVLLYGVQLREANRSAGRAVGILFEKTALGVVIVGLEEGGPAARGGLRIDDRLVAIERIDDYDIPARGFERGRPATYEVVRGGDRQRLAVVPGMPPPWLRLGFKGMVLLCYLGLALLTLLQPVADLRTRLLVSFLLLMAAELAAPLDLVGHRWLYIVAQALLFLITGAQMSVELHLASVLPERPRWLERRRWVIPLYYALGLVPTGVMSLTFLVEEIAERNAFPWSYVDLSDGIDVVALPLCSLAVLFLLGRSAVTFPEREGRLQAALVFSGVLPRAIYAVVGTSWELAGDPPVWFYDLVPLIYLCYPVAVFIAMFRYHLFDVELVVRRSLLYTSLTTALVLVLYSVLAAGGAVFSQLVDGDRHSIWVVSGAALLLGLLFGSLRRWLRKVIDRRFFPERQALRQRLIELAKELPAQGAVAKMGAFLTERLCGVFALRSATLLLAEPRTGVLLTVAASRGDEAKRGLSLSLIITPQDPGMELVARGGKPLPAARVVAASPALQQRFALLRAELVVPLIHHERLVGALILGAPASGRFPAEEVELLDLFAHQIASAFENVRLFASATYESLTGLLRREAILELLEREVERAQRYQRPLSIGFADLDHFKAVNDRYGHLAGDLLLKRVAEELSSGLRSTDAIGRYGGEEFLLVFPETNLDGAAVVAEKIRARIARIAVPMEDGTTVDVRISIGLADLGSLGNVPEPSQALIAAADAALYRAKAGGRNRVEPAVAAG